MRERDVTARVNYYICAGSEHLLGLLLKCNKNYIILKKMLSAAQWNILHHPSTYGTKITGIQNFGHLCLGALYKTVKILALGDHLQLSLSCGSHSPVSFLVCTYMLHNIPWKYSLANTHMRSSDCHIYTVPAHLTVSPPSHTERPRT